MDSVRRTPYLGWFVFLFTGGGLFITCTEPSPSPAVQGPAADTRQKSSRHMLGGSTLEGKDPVPPLTSMQLF